MRGIAGGAGVRARGDRVGRMRVPDGAAEGVAAWHPPERLGSLVRLDHGGGGLGALAATTPLEIALRLTGWRTFSSRSLSATLAVALVHRVARAGHRPAGARHGFAAQWTGVRRVFRHPRFWWIAPLGAFCMGSFFAIQGLWAVPWLMEVEGYDAGRGGAAPVVDERRDPAGFFFAGHVRTRLAQRGVHARHIFAAGFGLAVLSLARSSCGCRAASCGGRSTGSERRSTCWRSRC